MPVAYQNFAKAKMFSVFETFLQMPVNIPIQIKHSESYRQKFDAVFGKKGGEAKGKKEEGVKDKEWAKLKLATSHEYSIR